MARAKGDQEAAGPGIGALRRTLVLGLGNPFLTDDRVGLLAASRLRERFEGRPGIAFVEASVAGFDLLDLVTGFDRVIYLDAIQTPGARPGAIHCLGPEALPASERLATSHEINLATALALGRLFGLDMPTENLIYAIEVADPRTFGTTCTPGMDAAVDRVVALVSDLLDEGPAGSEPMYLLDGGGALG